MSFTRRARPLGATGGSRSRAYLVASVKIPTCDACGEEWLNASQTKALDLALEQVYGQELRRLAGEQLAKIADAGL
jgi:hypothetical protein